MMAAASLSVSCHHFWRGVADDLRIVSDSQSMSASHAITGTLLFIMNRKRSNVLDAAASTAGQLDLQAAAVHAAWLARSGQ